MRTSRRRSNDIVAAALIRPTVGFPFTSYSSVFSILSKYATISMLMICFLFNAISRRISCIKVDDG